MKPYYRQHYVFSVDYSDWVFRLCQGFRFRYHETGLREESVRDGDPNSAQFTVPGLRPDTEYSFRVSGYSQLGVGRYTDPPLIVRTSGECCAGA